VSRFEPQRRKGAKFGAKKFLVVDFMGECINGIKVHIQQVRKCCIGTIVTKNNPGL